MLKYNFTSICLFDIPFRSALVHPRFLVGFVLLYNKREQFSDPIHFSSYVVAPYGVVPGTSKYHLIKKSSKKGIQKR